MKANKYQEEQDFYLSGWENREANDSQSEDCIRRLKQDMEIVNKKIALPLSKVPFRQHKRNKTKDFYQSKVSDLTNLRRDKQLLQQYLTKQNHELNLRSHRTSCQQEYFPLKRHHLQTEIFYPKMEKIQNHQSVEVKIRNSHPPQQPRNYLEKYTLFSGINNEKREKRKYLFRNNSKESLQRPKLRIDQISPKIGLMASKLTFEKIDRMKHQNNTHIQIHKKALKFPLYYRQLTSKQQKNRKSKHSSTMNLEQNKDLMKHSAEFMDDNIFSSKHLRL